ncbi:metal dependent phosphohydrolase [Xylaria sp. FL0933]|nr:metal dependent phosphohydrolase [Xylaria sp. FL0933]
MPSSSSSSTYPFPDLPISGLTFPHSPITTAAFAHTKKYTTEAIYNHCARSACFALLLIKKLAPLAALNPDPETVVLACVLHDMGWSFDKALLSSFKRFEIDGADHARGFIGGYEGEGKEMWDRARVQRVWDAIVLHSTFSLAPFGSAEVAAVSLGVMADFQGPRFAADSWGDPAKRVDTPGAVITVDEFREVMAAFPYVSFGEERAKEIFCGLCRDKPATTFDNFVSGFGREFGYDGKGGGKEQYTKMWEKGAGPDNLLGNFEYLRGLL